MKVGMLWFDADRKTAVRGKIERAALYYRSKYGRSPNACFVHPETMGEHGPQEVAGIIICASGSVLPNHFWLGIMEDSPGDKAQPMKEAA